MNKTIVSLLFLFILALKGNGQEIYFPTDKMVYNKKSQYLKKIQFTESINSSKTDFIYQRMEWDVDPAVRYISGKVTSYIKSTVTQLDTFEFDLHQVLLVDSVIHDNTSIPFSRKDNKIFIPLDVALNKNQIDSISIYYQGVPPFSNFGSFATDKRAGNLTPVLWTLSEPYGAMEWWPCKQSLSDKIDSIDVLVTTPEKYRTASNGLLVSEDIQNQKRKMHWKHRFPIATYLIAIATTDYADYSDFLELEDGTSIEILNYVYPENLAKSKSETPVTSEIMALFNNLVGLYPFASEKYGHAQFGWGGGMEHQTMSFMGNFSFGLIAHELAHQWFGDYITLGTWQDIWLNEGFASYLTAIAYEHLRPDFWPVWKKNTVEEITFVPGGSVFVNDTTDVSRLFNRRLSYQKASYILHMLRWTLGDEDFFKGIRSYYTDPLIANGFARTSQLIQHFENTADTTLTEFFNDWLYGEGYPIYSASYSQNASNELTIILDQETSHSSVDFFEMPVPIRLYSYNKTDSIDVRLNHTLKEQEFTVNSGFSVAELKIDPDYWLLSKTGTIVGIPSQNNNFEPKPFPNPATDRFSILNQPLYDIKSIKLYTLKGELLKSFTTPETFYNIEGLYTGTYILQLETQKTTFHFKIIKQ